MISLWIRCLRWLGRTGLVLAALAVVYVPQQSAAQSAGKSGIPRTTSGHPSLQGHWTNTTVVPVQRPEELGEQRFLSAEEAEARLQRSLQITETTPGTAADVHYQLDDFGLDRSQNEVVTDRATSIIIDPPNGRLPAATPEAVAKLDASREYRRVHGFDSAKHRPLAERCIVWANAPMLPIGYNSNFQIMQTDDHVVIVMEMIHDARIIPLDGAKHLPPHIGQWLGDAVGRWEGDTLVVETTNFTGEVGVRAAGGYAISPEGRLTERFTRMDDNTIRYEFTVDDPNTWTQPWSGDLPMTKIDGPMFEYACHEGNYGLANNLSGARADERKAATQAN